MIVRLPLCLWALLVYANATGVHPVNPDWAWRYFLPPVGEWSLGGVAAAQGRNAGALLGLAALDLAWWGAGARVAGLAGAAGLPAGLGGLVRLGLGFAVLGTLAAGLGLVGLVSTRSAAVVVAFGLACAPRLPQIRWRELTEGARAAPAAAALGGAASLAGLLGALAPEVTEDAHRYFLEVPRQALVLGRLVPMGGGWPLDWNPLLPFGLHWPAVALFGETAVSLLNWQGYLLAGLTIAGWAGGRAGAWAAAAWLCGMNVPVFSQLAWADGPVALAGVVAARVQFALHRPRLAGWLWGVPVAVKYQAGWAAAAAAAGAWRRFGPRAGFGLLAGACACALPWTARGWLQAGSPLAPFWMAWGPDGVRSLVPPFYAPGAAWGADRTWSAVLAAPFTRAVTRSIWDGPLSPAWVAVLPVAFASGVRGLGWLLGAAVLGWAWFSGHAGRYLYPVAPILLAAAALGARRLVPDRVVRPAALAAALALAWELAVGLTDAFYALNPAGVTLGRETPDGYRERMLDPRPAAWRMRDALAERVGPRDRVLASGCLHAAGWPGLPLLDGEGLPPRAAVFAREAARPDRIAIRLRQRGVRWIVVRESPPVGGLGFDDAVWNERARAAWDAFLGARAPLVARRTAAGASFALRRVTW